MTLSKKIAIPVTALPFLAFSLLLLSSCAGFDPRKPNLKLRQTLPTMKVTNYTQALGDLGLMTEVYGVPKFKIQCNPIGDNTGSSGSTGSEIPRDITEMMKSSLNGIGGKVVFIPYDPSFMQNQVVTGYSNFANKTIPDVVLTGGITEFDRGLETRESTTDVSGGAEINGLPESLSNKEVALKYSSGMKSGLARITLDFNLLDFKTMTGIPKMNIVNTMEVLKGLQEKELGISLFGQSFGGKGVVKKVQGRHAAVRLLVELSMIQMVGKHMRLPYWRVLGPDAKPDKYVMDQLAEHYRSLTEPEIIAHVQEWLYLCGYDTEINGQFDQTTLQALQAVQMPINPEHPKINFEIFAKVYLNVPVTPEAKLRREKLDGM